MTAKFLKTYLWAFIALAFIFVIGAVVATDIFPNDVEIARHATVLTVFSLPALVCFLAFGVAKIINFKSAKLFRCNFSAIAIDLAIVLVFLVMTLIYVKMAEERPFGALIDFGYLNFRLVLFFAVLAAVPVILLKASLTNIKERIAELNWDKLSGKFFLIFYFATLLFAFISIFFGLIIYKTCYYYYSGVCLGVVSGMLCFTLAVALVALLSAAADFLSKHTKSISVLLLIVFIIVIIFGSLLYVVLSLQGNTTRAFYVTDVEKYYAGEYYENEGDGEYTYEEYGDGVEYEGYYRNEDEDPLDENNKLAFLWNDTAADDENVETAIKYGLKNFPVIEDEHIAFYNNNFSRLSTCGWSHYAFSEGGYSYYRIMQYICQYRSRIPLLTLAEAYWDQIEKYMPKKIYKKKKIDVTVDMLLWVHNNVENPAHVFGRINNTMTKRGLTSIEDYYPHIEKYVDIENLPYPLKIEGDEINERLVVWAYSFWGRRYSEGIAEDVYAILDKLSKSYQ